MLYMADRTNLQTIGRTVTGDRPFAMDNGPVLTRIYDLIRGRDPEVAIWNEFIRTIGPQDVKLIADPGLQELSRFEIEALQSIAKEYADLDDYEVADATHEFPEWKKNIPLKRSSKKIPWDDVLEALDLMKIKTILVEEAKSHELADRIL